ncbi:hypothetical protein Geob_0765 [Geotalea daltonii FRC-32]|uniref:Uncharacterized protein n=1 Tax=Geotalea daltonii (strain DSM 22248 / JCM 15807 / FRC-32) TaxID=316067 RepID=B9M157_GEODF|nr:hypothetical protein [Geotalea daltonii]ACM19127.1 hypothetical protein Geob_0765 [Geotalea daltonii FRC-32]
MAKISAGLLIIFLMFLSITADLNGGLTTAAFGEEAWKEKLMGLCAKTDVAMTLSSQELKELIAGCEKLQPIIDGLEESPRKVYGKRLKMCRDLFVYVLEAKGRDAK